MVSRTARRLVADVPAIAAAHFEAESDPYHPGDNPKGYVNLGTAENRLVWDLLAPRLAEAGPPREPDCQYAPLHGAPELRAATAALLSRRWNTAIDPADLVVVSGATAALDILATVLCDPGEAVVTPAPYYAAFETDLTGRSGARLLPAPMDEATGYALSPAVLDRVLGSARRDGVTVRALALTSPSNPVGHVYSPGVLRDVLRVAEEHDVDVIADEIYAHSVFGSAAFTSMLDPAVAGRHASRVHGVWGFAKDFGLPGLKAGVLYTRDPDVRATARALAYFAPVSTQTQATLTRLIGDTAWVRDFLAESRRRLGRSYAATASLLARHGIPHVEASGGFSVWIDLRGRLSARTTEGEHALWQEIFKAARVNILPGTVFGCPRPGWFRLCHATDAGTVAAGVTRLAGVLGETR
ncbi:aminotransferase [Sphaerisporangium krabiense]|uniref:Aspartate/methionine/tyrosine aminotransferase n=1 Tax=Sphaerisporangium krabiense TaxID=763782 RepID=A0A7W8Z4L1_9ACTN|nr:aminotransferase class I/II-fold pyridoxal phosphate-dependent enzyme [Sphaerisporangium krabiense]MBB5627120.1 aspartate/methionine/tyrosine aminotransferase [Sphaerisporangium krabiense]GII65278.1 aminotransferase [Sphaerisporangium krabiense]